MTTPLLQIEHNFNQPITLNLHPDTLVADVGVLTKDTTQITIRKKNGAGTKMPDQFRFFTIMGTEA